MADRGAYAVIFQPNLNTVGAIDLTLGENRLRSHVLGVYITDYASAKSVLVAAVKDSIGEVLKPNRIIYRSAFDGLDADMRFTYKKGVFEADLILKQKLVLPEGFSPTSSRLELVTEFMDPPTADIRQCALASPEGINLLDDALLDFGGLMMVPGKAFSVEETGASLDGQTDNMLRVLKRWQQIDGRQVLIESVSWTEVEAHTKSLASGNQPARQARLERELPAKRVAAKNPRSVRVASLPYKESGFVIDYITVVTQPSWTFRSTLTYLVPNLVTISSYAEFQSGAIIKIDRAGGMTLSGTVLCPPDGSAHLTARDDTSMGDDTSTGALTGYYGNPHYINLYPNTPSTVLKNLNIRYAKEGVATYTPSYSQTVQDSTFETCEKGVTAYFTTVTLQNLIFCNTPTQYYNYGGGSFSVSGLTINCGVVNASKTLGHQAEPAIAVTQNPSNPNQTRIVIVAMYAGTDPFQTMLQMVSDDSGGTWTTTSLPKPGMATPHGDSDPSLAYDDWGNLFLAYRAIVGGSVQVALYVSSDAGANWSAVPGFNGSGATGATPKVATGPKLGNPLKSSVWVTLDRGTGQGLSCMGTEVRGVGASNIGPTWTSQTPLPNSMVQLSTLFSSLAIGPNGEVLVAHIVGSGTTLRDAPVTCYTALDNDGLGSGGFVSQGSFQINLGWELIRPMGEVSELVPIPTLDWDRARNKIYVVYADKATQSGESDDNTDIYVRTSTNGGAIWSDRVKVNDDSTTTSQFHPRLAVDQNTGKVAVSWYDCRNDPDPTTGNKKTHFFAAVSTDGFASAQPRNFQLNPLQSNATITDLGGGGYKEYVGLAYFKGFLYPVWIDNSNSTGDNPDGTLSKFDVYIGKVPY